MASTEMESLAVQNHLQQQHEHQNHQRIDMDNMDKNISQNDITDTNHQEHRARARNSPFGTIFTRKGGNKNSNKNSKSSDKGQQQHRSQKKKNRVTLLAASTPKNTRYHPIHTKLRDNERATLYAIQAYQQHPQQAQQRPNQMNGLEFWQQCHALQEALQKNTR